MRYGTPAKGITTITPTCTCGWTGSTARWTGGSQRAARTEWLTHPAAG
jgi:hypothetical protein